MKRQYHEANFLTRFLDAVLFPNPQRQPVKITVPLPKHFLIKPRGDYMHRTLLQMEHFGVINVLVAPLN